MFAKKIKKSAKVVKVESADLMNPAQYITKGGSPCAGSTGRYHVDFEFEDGTHQTFNVSGKQAGNLSNGMNGILTYHRNIFDGFESE